MAEKPINYTEFKVRATADGRKTQERVVIPQPPEKWDCCDPIYGYPADHLIGFVFYSSKDRDDYGYLKNPFRHGKPGDVLWVREAWTAGWVPQHYYMGAIEDGWPEPHKIRRDGDYLLLACYKADGEEDKWRMGNTHWPWKPSIHMPRWASRIHLDVLKVRVERVQDISEEDARAEGLWSKEFTYAGAASTGQNDFHDYAYTETRYGWKNSQDPGDAFTTARSAYQNLWNSINAKRGYGWDVNPWVAVLEFKVKEVRG